MSQWCVWGRPRCRQNAHYLAVRHAAETRCEPPGARQKRIGLVADIFDPNRLSGSICPADDGDIDRERGRQALVAARRADAQPTAPVRWSSMPRTFRDNPCCRPGRRRTSSEELLGPWLARIRPRPRHHAVRCRRDGRSVTSVPRRDHGRRAGVVHQQHRPADDAWSSAVHPVARKAEVAGARNWRERRPRCRARQAELGVHIGRPMTSGAVARELLARRIEANTRRRLRTSTSDPATSSTPFTNCFWDRWNRPRSSRSHHHAADNPAVDQPGLDCRLDPYARRRAGAQSPGRATTGGRGWRRETSVRLRDASQTASIRQTAVRWPLRG